jgi:hypothetical protein
LGEFGLTRTQAIANLIENDCSAAGCSLIDRKNVILHMALRLSYW